MKKEYQEKQQKKKEKEEAKKSGKGDKSPTKDEDKGKDSKTGSKESDETDGKSSVVEVRDTGRLTWALSLLTQHYQDTPMTQEEPRIFELKRFDSHFVLASYTGANFWFEAPFMNSA